MSPTMLASVLEYLMNVVTFNYATMECKQLNINCFMYIDVHKGIQNAYLVFISAILGMIVARVSSQLKHIERHSKQLFLL